MDPNFNIGFLFNFKPGVSGEAGSFLGKIFGVKVTEEFSPI